MADSRRPFVSAGAVAERAGVSRSAVSRTFTAGASVSPKTRAKVLKAAAELGYHVNLLARGLISEESGIVCLVAADIHTPYQSALLEAVTRRLQDADKVAMVLNTVGEAGNVERALRLALSYRADATVVLSGSPPAVLVDAALAAGQRVILVNRGEAVPGAETVVVDDTAAAREAFAMIVRAGCRRLAVVASTAGTPSLSTREAAFVASAAAAGIETTVMRAGPTAYATGVEAARHLLAGSVRPDGAFCVTDLLACGVLDAARHDFGLAVPDEFCVVGFDDIDQAGWSSYDLTTFRQPIAAIADHIAAVIAKPAGASFPAAARFPAAPVWRRSVRAK